jgi:hypothetical protein
MRYDKPIVMDLNARARFAAGQGPLGCYDGGAAGSSSEICYTGTGANFTYEPCWTGSSPADNADCIGGTSAYYCESGAGGGSDPDGCRVGPSVV